MVAGGSPLTTTIIFQIVFEKIKTEEHEVYNSNDSDTSDDGADFEKIEYSELSEDQPLEYKTRTEESFIEYFQKGEVNRRHTDYSVYYTQHTSLVNYRLLFSMFCFNKFGGGGGGGSDVLP